MWQPGKTLESIEREVIQQAFRFYQGNKTATANSLGIAIRTLDAKLEKYNSPVASSNEKQKEGSDGLRTEGRVRVEPAKKLPQEQKVSLRK